MRTWRVPRVSRVCCSNKSKSTVNQFWQCKGMHKKEEHETMTCTSVGIMLSDSPQRHFCMPPSIATLAASRPAAPTYWYSGACKGCFWRYVSLNRDFVTCDFVTLRRFNNVGVEFYYILIYNNYYINHFLYRWADEGQMRADYFMVGAYCHKVTCHKVRQKSLTDFHILRR